MEEVQEEREYSKWEWFFYIIFIPALFATLLAGTLLTFLGVNVVGEVLDVANKIPYVEKIAPDISKEDGAEDIQATTQKEMAAMQSELTKNQKANNSLKEDIAKKESTIMAMQKQVEELRKMMEQKKTTEEERQKQYQDLAKVYTTMSAKNAAAIIENLAQEEAVTVMTKMKPDQRAQILAKMEPKNAADISILIKDTTVAKDDDVAALQQRVQILTKALSDTRENSGTTDDLVNTFSQMGAEDASKIITTLMTTNQKRAVSILTGMGNDKRAQILAAVSKDNPELAARITSELPR